MFFKGRGIHPIVLRIVRATVQVMNGKGKNPGEVIPHLELLNEPCWIQCQGYRCLAVLRNGRWLTYATGEELADFIKVISAIPAAWL